MSTSTATLPGFGHAFSAAVSHFCSAVFKGPKAKPAAAKLSTGARLWQLFLTTGGIDSIDPALLVARIVQD